MKVESSLWVEKYRPKTVDDMVLPEEYAKEIKSFVVRQEIPNILLSGPAGGGKTTLARIVCSSSGVLNVPRSNLLEFNGSSQEARGVGYVQKVIEPFLRVPPAGNDKYKIVFIDEMDNLTPDSFKSLRGVIEKYQIKYGRFIGTCNYISKIPDPVQSRFTPFVFKQIPIEFVKKYARELLEKEGIEYQEDDLKYIVDNLYPDVRKITNNLQRMSATGKLTVNKDIALTVEKALVASVIAIVNHIKAGKNQKINKEMSSIINLLDKQDMEFSNVYESLFNNKAIPIPAKIIVNKYSREHLNCLVPSMHVSAMIFEIIQTISQYFQSIK